MFEGLPIMNDHQVVICCDVFFCVFSSLGITTTDIGCLKISQNDTPKEWIKYSKNDQPISHSWGPLTPNF